MSDTTAAPYRIWMLPIPFNKHGDPVPGNFGASVRSVVILDADTFRRLVSGHPSLRDAQFQTVDFLGVTEGP